MFYPLRSLSPVHNDYSLLRPGEPHALSHENSRDMVDSTNPNVSPASGRTSYDEISSKPNVIEPVPAARPSSSSSAQKLPTIELVSNSSGEPNKFSLSEWRWEFSAAALSLACFAAIVGVLVAYGDKALSSWDAAFGITLNTMIATLSTLSKTALLVPVASCLSQLKWIHMVTASRALNDIQIFDDASRGPWGSLELIWRIHIKAKLAAWGSIITIVALVMSPFAQQLLSYPSRSIESAGGVFYKSQSYDVVA